MKRIQIALLALVFVSIHCSAQINTVAIDSIVQNAVTAEFFEGTVLVAENGTIIYSESFGFKDTESLQPVTSETHFGIASITKLFTAIVVMQLVEEGKFTLSDTLAKLVPELAIPKAKKITVHHLLLHISGLPNEADAIYHSPKTPKEFVFESVKNKGSSFGSFNYANIDYVLLGLIIEKYDARSWEQSVQDRILDVAEMQDTGFLKMQHYPEDFAYSFSYDDKNVRRKDSAFYIENFYAAGCMHATAADLLKLDQAMYGKLLSEKSKELMFTSYPEYNYSGYSVWTYNYPFGASKPRIMERRGGILGANSVLIRMLDTNKTIIILSNNNKFNPDSFGNTKSLKEALMVEVDKNKP